MKRGAAIIALAVMAAPVGWLTFVAGQFLVANLLMSSDPSLSGASRGYLFTSIGGALAVLLLPLVWGMLLFAAHRAWKPSRIGLWICPVLFAVGMGLGLVQFGPFTR